MITMIAAIAQNRVIGHHGKLPWSLPEDMKLFREYTSNNTVVMGRKTFESIGKPLPNRHNIVVSSTLSPRPGLDVCSSYEDAIKKAKAYGKEIFIIGGATLYEQAFNDADRMLISHVKETFEGDTYFPEWDQKQWKLFHMKEFDQFTFKEYRRESTV